MAELTAKDTVYKFCQAIVKQFGSVYLRAPHEQDNARIFGIERSKGISWGAWKHQLHALGMEELVVCLARDEQRTH
jgi:hypothetical protein